MGIIELLRDWTCIPGPEKELIMCSWLLLQIKKWSGEQNGQVTELVGSQARVDFGACAFSLKLYCFSTFFVNLLLILLFYHSKSLHKTHMWNVFCNSVVGKALSPKETSMLPLFENKNYVTYHVFFFVLAARKLRVKLSAPSLPSSCFLLPISLFLISSSNSLLLTFSFVSLVERDLIGIWKVVGGDERSKYKSEIHMKNLFCTLPVSLAKRKMVKGKFKWNNIRAILKEKKRKPTERQNDWQ